MNRFWTFWTLTEQILNITENSEQILNILNMDWTESEQILNITEHYWKFWTWTEQILNILSKYIMWYFTY
jgi:hypothetical protein